MPNEKKTGPDYRDTQQLPRVEVDESQLGAVLSEVRAMRAEGQETRATVNSLATNVEVLTKHVDTLTSRVILVERRQDEADGRATHHSGGLVRASETDAKHDAAIATLVTDVAELRKTQVTQLAILTRLDSVAANPMVRRIAYGVGLLVLAWLASHGVRPL